MNLFMEKILHLLVNTPGELSDICQRILASGSPILKSFDLTLKEVRDVYYARSEFNELRGGEIKGFKDLVLGLRKETEPLVAVQSITVGSQYFMVFTTTDMSRLIGILLFPDRLGQ